MSESKPEHVCEKEQTRQRDKRNLDARIDNWQARYWGHLPLALIVGLCAGAIATASYKPRILIVHNPVISEGTRNAYSVSSCQEGFLARGVEYRIPKGSFTIVRDLKTHQRPLLVMQQTLHKLHSELHLTADGKIPKYVSYGNAGAMSYFANGTYPCPDWQWKDER